MNRSPGNLLSAKDKKLLIITAAAVTAIFLAMVGYSAAGLRGTDQYWYVSDVETLVNGQEKVTNTIYPVHFQKTGITDKPRFIHNILNLYMVLPAAEILGAFNGWITTNIIASILSALMIAYIIAQRSTTWAAVAGYSIFLLMPLNIWLVSQPLAESTTTFFVAAFLMLYILESDSKNIWKWSILAVLAALGYWCRFTLLPLALLIPVVYAWKNFRKQSIPSAVFLAVFIFILLAVKPLLFPDGASIPFTSILHTAIPGISGNMETYFSVEPIQTGPEIFTKSIHGLTLQFFPSGAMQIFYLPFNILGAISIFYIARTRNRFNCPIAQCIVLLLSIHLATIMLCQNQFRYLLLILPAIIIGSAMGLMQIRLIQTYSKTALLIILAILITADLPITNHLHKDSIRQASIRKDLNNIIKTHIKQDQAVVLETVRNESMLMGYILKPAPVYILQQGTTDKAADFLSRNLDAAWLICTPSSNVLNIFAEHNPEPVGKLPGHYEYLRLYKLDSNQEK